MTILVTGDVHQVQGRYLTSPAEAMFLNELTRQSATVLLCAWVRPSENATKSVFGLCPLERGVQVVPLTPYGGLRSLFSVSDLAKLVSAMGRASALHLFSGTLGLKIYALNRFTFSRPFTIYERGHWLDETHVGQSVRSRLGPLSSAYLKITSKLRASMIQDATAVFVHGKELREECSCLRSAKDVYDVVPMTPLRPSDRYQRDGASVGPTPSLLYVGGIAAKKGLEVFLDACRELQSPYRVRLVLQERPTDDLQRRINLLDPGAVEIKVAEPWEGVRDSYRSCDVLVVPSLDEGFPRVLYEGMSQSIPIVVTDLPGIHGTMTSGVNCLIVPRGNAASLAQAIGRLTQETSTRAALIHEGLKTMDALFAAQKYRSHADQLLDTYQRLLPPEHPQRAQSRVPRSEQGRL